jgi:glycerol uptake facilitator protein
MSIFFGEFVGTLLLILLGNGAVANVLLTKSKGENSGWIVITAGWGFAVSVAVYAIGWASGGHINPAVTLGLIIAGKSSWALMPLYLSGQMLGALVGAFLVWVTYFPHWKKTSDAGSKLVCFCTKPAVLKPWSNFATEAIATCVLLMGILSIFDTHNSIAYGMAPFLVGILVFSIGLSLGGPTGFAINPARDLGPRIMHAILPLGSKASSDWSYCWIPIFGPLVGGAFGAWLYSLITVHLYALQA